MFSELPFVTLSLFKSTSAHTRLVQDQVFNVCDDDIEATIIVLIIQKL